MTGKNATAELGADDAGIAEAARILLGGGIVAVPTETVYGLAARADSTDAVARIYAAKGRPDFNPLIVHVQGTDQARALARWDERAERLARQFWPGPLTMVLPLGDDAGLAPAVTAGLPTVALRSPGHPAMRAVLAQVAAPLAAPSANRSGAVSPTRAAHVLASLAGRIDAVVDGGDCAEGLESTIVALRPDGGWHLLRPGPVTEAAIAAQIGPPGVMTGTGSEPLIEAPGQLASHYSPGKPLRLAAMSAEDDEFLIGFGPVTGHCNLSPSGDLAEAAARLYLCLHLGAAAAQPRVAVAPIPESGLGVAINDRLRRAAV
ncbi:threonylcarbamoyl-AMP synthase [Leptolyngbya sp. 15MV]|nr:threonylcarbamoyl-AMP synthase [Leptolyngbya sp. 15MV]